MAYMGRCQKKGDARSLDYGSHGPLPEVPERTRAWNVKGESI